MKQETACGAIVYTCIDNQIYYVIIESTEGIHGFPKGHIEKGETEEETALREIYEEVHLQPKIIDDFRISEEYDIPRRNSHKTNIYFIARYENQEIKIQEEELKSAGLLPFEEALDAFEYESAKKILKKADSFIRDTVK